MSCFHELFRVAFESRLSILRGRVRGAEDRRGSAQSPLAVDEEKPDRGRDGGRIAKIEGTSRCVRNGAAVIDGRGSDAVQGSVGDVGLAESKPPASATPREPSKNTTLDESDLSSCGL